ncbi:hypothetical protein EIN_403650 [Entamoeba invadens IP1]|uniref:Uncharacterized protein n=1 Tax=Entamoeba invadens IP1 TaxID=370355 RepID=A0A0A1UA48_ENTIV|nr:hypothetical protein EIN_403650 [Entamoeba invadens IP1]ELP90031.1 hypothetical protein EIN_403650 [Entamoeba invadens IP1]|eukprot:XP_004256802.1 hypothetical protein EIN_403650 [Entamoeba invadens IP1]
MAIECDVEITSEFSGYLSEDWMYYCCSNEISLYDFNPSTEQLEFVGVCGKFVFLKSLAQQRIAIAIKDNERPLLFVFRELDPLCTVEYENYTIKFHNNGFLFAIVFTDDEECKRCFECINRQVIKHFNKLLKRKKLTPEDARASEIKLTEVVDNAMKFGSDDEKIKHYLNCTLPYYHLPNPFKKLGIPQTVDLAVNLPPEIEVPDPTTNQRKGMGLNPPVIPILVLQSLYKETTHPEIDTEQESHSAGTPRKVGSRLTISEFKLKTSKSAATDLALSNFYPKGSLSPRMSRSRTPRSSRLLPLNTE